MASSARHANQGAALPAPAFVLVTKDVALPERGAGTFHVVHSPPSRAIKSHLLLFHGAGLTVQSFAAMVQALPSTIGVWAFDCRGHGRTTVEPAEDWTLDTLVKDANALLDHFAWRQPAAPPCFLVGHSMGGCVAIRAAWKDVKGLVVIDAVEGVALSSLDAGAHFVETRPAEFASVDDAVAWSLTYGPLRGAYSAKLSVPDQVVHNGHAFVWRTDLKRTIPFWPEWFTGASNAFIEAPCAKLLILAGVEKLDTPLSAAHMMGKYQLVVMPSVAAGHFVHEDAPGLTVGAIAHFVNRQLGAPKGGMTAEQVIALQKQMTQR